MSIILMTPFTLYYFVGSIASLRQRGRRGKLIKEFEQSSTTRWMNSKSSLYGLMILVIILQSILFWEGTGKLAQSDFMLPLFWLGLFPYLIVINGPPRIYEHGICNHGFLITWDRIESYRWDRGGFYEFTALRFKKASISLFEAGGFQFPDEDRRLVAELMTQHAPEAVCDNPNADESRPTDTYVTSNI